MSKNFNYFTKELKKNNVQASLLAMCNYINVSPEKSDLYFCRKPTIHFDFHFCQLSFSASYNFWRFQSLGLSSSFSASSWNERVGFGESLLGWRRLKIVYFNLEKSSNVRNRTIETQIFCSHGFAPKYQELLFILPLFKWLFNSIYCWK